MKTITYAQLVAELAKPGATIVGLETLTDARLRKTGNTLGAIFKRARNVAMVGAKYEAAVNRQQERDYGRNAGFKADGLPRPGDTWLIPNKVIQNSNGTLYLRTQSTAGQRRVRPAIVQFVKANGHKVTYEEVKPFLPAKSYSMKQEQSGNIASGFTVTHEVNQVDVRDYKFESIKKIRLNGRTYGLTPA